MDFPEDPTMVRIQPSLDERIATSKLYEEESLKRLALLDQRLKRLEKLDERLAQLKSTHSSPPRAQAQIHNPDPHFANLPGMITSEETTKSFSAIDKDSQMRAHASLGVSPILSGDGLRRNSEEVLRHLVQEEIESLLVQGKLAGATMPVKYSGTQATNASELLLRAYSPASDVSIPDSSRNLNLMVDGRRSSEGKRGKVAWGLSPIDDRSDKLSSRNMSRRVSDDDFPDKNDFNSFPKDINPAPKPQEISNVLSRTPSQSSSLHRAVDKYAQVESRRACLSPEEELKSVRVVDIKEPRTLDEAMEHTMPYFFGGFTRQSPVRAKCFQMNRSAKWKACFIIINLANCLYITLVPEVDRATFNSEISTNSQTTRRRGLAIVTQPQFVSPSALGSNPHFAGQSRWLLSSSTAAPVTSSDNSAVGLAEFFEFFCVGAILAELLIGSIAVGFVASPTAYLRCSYFHKLDFIILLMSGLEYFLIYSQASSALKFSKLETQHVILSHSHWIQLEINTITHSILCSV